MHLRPWSPPTLGICHDAGTSQFRDDSAGIERPVTHCACDGPWKASGALFRDIAESSGHHTCSRVGSAGYDHMIPLGQKTVWIHDSVSRTERTTATAEGVVGRVGHGEKESLCDR